MEAVRQQMRAFTRQKTDNSKDMTDILEYIRQSGDWTGKEELPRSVFVLEVLLRAPFAPDGTTLS